MSKFEKLHKFALVRSMDDIRRDSTRRDSTRKDSTIKDDTRVDDTLDITQRIA